MHTGTFHLFVVFARLADDRGLRARQKDLQFCSRPGWVASDPLSLQVGGGHEVLLPRGEDRNSEGLDSDFMCLARESLLRS